MKHLKTYTLFERVSKETKLFEGYGDNPSINWELLNDARHLALEYLDEGYKLCYKVYENELVSLGGNVGGRYVPSSLGIKVVVEGIFSHDGDEFKWNEFDFYEPDPVDYDLSYDFWFLVKTPKQFQLNNPLTSLVSHLREIYPNEKIT